MNWSPSNWKNAKVIKQMPFYEDKERLDGVKSEISNLDGLLKIDEILKFKAKLKDVADGKSFLIVAGDCAEPLFNNDINVINTIDVINKISDIISKKTGKNVIRVGRMAGQYAKPRTNDEESRDGVVLPVYRGDIINNFNFSKESREADPDLMKIAYIQSKKTLELIRKTTNDFYIAHECLLLDYEEALVKKDGNDYYLSSTHFPWIGYRTLNIESAHVEFLRGVINPISVKCGEKTNVDELIEIIKILNPKNEIGKIVLTVRFSSQDILENTVSMINKVKESGLNVIWMVDPMHGNTKKLNNLKVRYVDDILQETKNFIKACKIANVYFGGIHLEMSGLDITECIGLNVNAKDIKKCYSTLCDPRLNGEQSLYIINNVVDLL